MSRRAARPARAAAGALAGALVTTAVSVRLRARPPLGAGRWERLNYAGKQVSLLEGPAVVGGLTVACVVGGPGVMAAGALAALGAGTLGVVDDLVGTAENRGLAGHLAALGRGEITTGAVKVVGLGVTGLLCGGLVRRGPIDRLLAAVVVAGTANLVNLLDLRPGRAVKATLLLAVPHLTGSGAPFAAAAVGAAAGAAREDLGERGMLGDAGANALGAVAGLAAASSVSRGALAARATALVALTLASERVSFSRVIARTPWLARVDGLGRSAPAA